ncbi:MAG: cardiolipin synthase [Woeseiaceae bacterium]|nr:cardiolipin synthase [Woeseiaceae bacterium]
MSPGSPAVQPFIVSLIEQPGLLALFAVVYTMLQIGGILAAVHAVFNARSSQGATAWAIALVTAPVISLLFYLVFGRNRFGGYVDARRTSDSEHHWLAEKARNVCDTYRSSLPDYGGRLSSLERLAHLPFTHGNRVEIYDDGRLAFDAMFRAIESAKSYVLVQFFIVRDDELGQRLKSLLVAKAREGVSIYFLIDELGSRKLSRAFISDCIEAGVRFEKFRSSKGWINRFQINFRNHRKIVVADGDLAFVGGLNVGNEYVGKSRRFGPWRDTHVEVEGPSADALQLIFAEDWHWVTGETLEYLEWETRPADGGDADVLVLPSGPADEIETCSLMFVHAIHSAQQRCWIASPYFVPNSEVVSALQVAGLRGVDVRILLPANPDHLMVYLASFHFMRVVGPRVRFYRYREGFMHQKAFLIDDFGVGIGTANLDNRSFRLNFEITLLSVNYDLARRVEAMFEKDFEGSDEVRHDEIEERGVVFRLGAAAARLLSPIL